MKKQAVATRILGGVLSFAAVAFIFGLGNVLLVGGQKLWHRGEQQRLNDVRDVLDNKRQDIAELEGQLQTRTQELERESEGIDRSKADIEAVEARHPSGIPQSLFGEYQASIKRFNATVAAHNDRREIYEPLYANYASRIDEYNALVKEANTLSKAIGGTWYVIPVPRASRTGARVRQ